MLEILILMGSNPPPVSLFPVDSHNTSFILNPGPDFVTTEAHQ